MVEGDREVDPPPYHVPEHLKEMASKTFAFNHSPHLPGAKLLHHTQEVFEWLDQGSYPKVLKSCFGFAGRKKTILQGEDYKEKVILKEFKKGHPIIGEPWVKRQMDFSTQWFLGDEISYLVVSPQSPSGKLRPDFLDLEGAEIDGSNAQAFEIEPAEKAEKMGQFFKELCGLTTRSNNNGK